MFQIANLLLEYKTVILSFLPYAAQHKYKRNILFISYISVIVCFIKIQINDVFDI